MSDREDLERASSRFGWVRTAGVHSHEQAPRDWVALPSTTFYRRAPDRRIALRVQALWSTEGEFVSGSVVGQRRLANVGDLRAYLLR